MRSKILRTRSPRIVFLALGCALLVGMPETAEGTPVSGTGYKYTTSGSVRAQYFQVKFCPDDGGLPSLHNCRSEWTDQSGNYRIDVDAGYRDPEYRDFWVYLWSDSDPWGSSTQPLGKRRIRAPGMEGVSLVAPPVPLQPRLISPANGALIDYRSVPLKWTDGLDGGRRTTRYTTTYEIWTTATPPGVPRGPEGLSVPDAPCNREASTNYCVFVAGPLDRYPGVVYTWRIVPKLNTNIPQPGSNAPTIYRGPSSATFSCRQ